MNITILGAAGFIGSNLALELSKNNTLSLVDRCLEYFEPCRAARIPNTRYVERQFHNGADFDDVLEGQDVVYHLVSTTMPTTSNQQIVQELETNVVFTAKLLDACVRQGVKKIIFLSSGGTVYGKEQNCPLKEDTPVKPISSYGVQKVMIERLLYLYRYMHGLDYRVIRLSNPYGPYQRPNGILGAITTFTYKALRNEKISVYGDGSVIRDFIYIDDAVKGIITIADHDNKHRTFNLGCGYGTSIAQVLTTIGEVLGKTLDIAYLPSRKVDVPVNYLDVSRYEACYGKIQSVLLEEGIRRTAFFLKKQYNI